MLILNGEEVLFFMPIKDASRRKGIRRRALLRTQKQPENGPKESV